MANITHIEIDGRPVVDAATADEVSAALDRGERRIACSPERAEEFGVPTEALFEDDDPDEDHQQEDDA